jgi:homeobox protein cut-like
VSSGGGDGAAVSTGGGGGAAPPGPASEASSMLQILKQQRDRFKSQMLAQSARAEQQRALADEATQRLSKLERDNVALYEKIRFLQAWKPKQARSGAGAGAPRSGSAGAGGSAVEQQYGALYKNGLDPFAAFKKREREAGGSYIERRFVGALASRRFREIAALYLILLHGVVCVCVAFAFAFAFASRACGCGCGCGCAPPPRACTLRYDSP